MIGLIDTGFDARPHSDDGPTNDVKILVMSPICSTPGWADTAKRDAPLHISYRSPTQCLFRSNAPIRSSALTRSMPDTQDDDAVRLHPIAQDIRPDRRHLALPLARIP